MGCAYRVCVAAVDEVEVDEDRNGSRKVREGRNSSAVVPAKPLAGAKTLPNRDAPPPNLTNIESRRCGREGSELTRTMYQLEGSRIRQLGVIFCAWKTLLLLLAAFCPGPGYDTSALILFDPSPHRHENFSHLARHDRLTLNLLRWDAFYFAKAAERGHIFEQEWAFSWAYSQLLRLTGQCECSYPLAWSGVNRRLDFCGSAACPLQYYIMAGIVLSHVFHFVSVLALYRLLAMILGPRQQRDVAFIASALHILTPASLFYSAPYAEALFSLLNLTGMILYAQSKAAAHAGKSPIREDAYKLSSGLAFASAALVRSNGLLSGLIFLYDVARYLPCIVSAQLDLRDVRRIIVTCVAGLLIAIGFVGPQYLAYTEFCSQAVDPTARPWCERSVPSIYTWVQSHYWYVTSTQLLYLPNPPPGTSVSSVTGLYQTCPSFY